MIKIDCIDTNFYISSISTFLATCGGFVRSVLSTVLHFALFRMEETSDVKQQVYFVADMMLNIQCLLETIQFKSYSFKILKSIGNLKC